MAPYWQATLSTGNLGQILYCWGVWGGLPIDRAAGRLGAIENLLIITLAVVEAPTAQNSRSMILGRSIGRVAVRNGSVDRQAAPNHRSIASRPNPNDHFQTEKH
jgi:hypothetical protein